MLNLYNMQKCSVVTAYKIFPDFRVMAVLFWYNWNYFISKIMSILLVVFLCSFFFTVVFSSHWENFFLTAYTEREPSLFIIIDVITLLYDQIIYPMESYSLQTYTVV